MTPPSAPLRAALRRAAADRRAALAPAERQAASRAVRDRLVALPAVRQARTVAAYLARGDELDLGPTLEALWAAGKQVLLPRVGAQGRRMAFACHAPAGPLRPNRYGILEPPPEAPTVAPRFLHAVLVPLVAFDAHGHRLGSGGGYYDRCFAFRTSRRAWRMPRLIGVGFACQAVPPIPTEPWDVPLDLVVTEDAVHDAAATRR